MARRTTSPIRSGGGSHPNGFTSLVAEKGHFMVYTIEAERFMVPLAYISNNIFRELLRMSEEEFGLSGDGPITLTCNAVFMKYAMSLIKRGIFEDLEKALVNSIFSGCSQSMSTLILEGNSRNFVEYGF